MSVSAQTPIGFLRYRGELGSAHGELVEPQRSLNHPLAPRACEFLSLRAPMLSGRGNLGSGCLGTIPAFIHKLSA